MHEPSGVNTVEVRAEDCASCHLDAWRATTAPAHASLGFGHTCGDCHDQTAWSPSHDFPHTTAFPLTLGHAEPSCASCHLSGFAERPTNSCVACHGGRAASVPDPVHAGLSTSCSACHKTDGFRPSTFKHAWPLSGVHAMLTCGSCHTGNPARYEGTLPACVGCHADDRARADRSVSGHGAYPTTCESCHGFAAFRPSSMK
ncbi:MAG: cytochrome c3 family protein [Polyangiales bacterium]